MVDIKKNIEQPPLEQPESATVSGGSLVIIHHYFDPGKWYRVVKEERIPLGMITGYTLRVGKRKGFKELIIHSKDLISEFTLSRSHRNLAKQVAKILQAKGYTPKIQLWTDEQAKKARVPF